MLKDLSSLSYWSTKAPIESEERRENNGKKKREKIVEVSREPAPTIVPAKESDSEERGGIEAYSEQPVLSPTADEAALTQIKVEKMGK